MPEYRLAMKATVYRSVYIEADDELQALDQWDERYDGTTVDFIDYEDYDYWEVEFIEDETGKEVWTSA